MKTIKSSSPSLRAHFGGLPSAALTAMAAGLLKAEKTKDCVVDMRTFGHFDGVTCFGCAATWTVQAALGRLMTPVEVNAQLTGAGTFKDQRWTAKDLNLFESAIDDARQGCLLTLFEYMKKSKHYRPEYDDLFRLQTDNWRSQLPSVRKLIRVLIKNNL